MASKPTRYETIAGRRVPLPTYDDSIDLLVLQYKNAMLEIVNELNRIDTSKHSRAQSVATLKEVQKILVDLDATAKDWIDEHIPKAALNGVALTLVSLGAAETFAEAEKIAKFNKINKHLVNHIVKDTHDDLLQLTQNVSRKVRSAVRQVTSEVMRKNFTKNINGVKTNKRQIVDELRKKLGASVESGIIDSAGKRWKPETYVDMVVRTKLQQASIEAATNEGLDIGAQYGIISYHGSKDACRWHEGRIVKLDPSAAGSYPTVAEIRASNQCFHPRCRHVVSPIYPEDLPKDVLDKAKRQAELGDRAIATGKRNPTDEEVY